MEQEAQTNKKKSGLAIASLILAILFIIPFASLIALILGINALVKISKNKEQLAGDGMAIAGVIMGALGVIFWLIFPLLAAIAIPSYINFHTRAKTYEAKTNLSSIRVCQEAYRAESDTYINCPKNPSTIPSGEKLPWQIGVKEWELIEFEPYGDVYYQYEVIEADNDLFTAVARGDLDGDGILSTFTIDQDGNLKEDKPLE